jgi:hypothetical protein
MIVLGKAVPPVVRMLVVGYGDPAVPDGILVVKILKGN